MAADNSKVLPRLNVCFIGHVDSGKSTCVGHLARQLGVIDERDFEKTQKEAELNNKASFGFAYITDKTQAEKERGITIVTTLLNIKTEKFDINIFDCPGHKDFIKNMVTGAAQADVGVVIVPASGFEACVGEGGMLKSHITISGVLGCKKLIVCVNKMDEIAEADRPKKFEEVKDEMLRIIKKSASDKDPIIIPISAYQGVGLTSSRGAVSRAYEWFKGWESSTDANLKGKLVRTLEEALNIQELPARNNNKPLRMPIVGIHKIPGIGVVFTGRVDSGVITPNMGVTIQPAGVVTEIKSLEIHKQSRSIVECGENCGIAFKNPSKGDLASVKAGHVISQNDATQCKVAAAGLARVIVIETPNGIAEGYQPVMDLGVHHFPVKIAVIMEKVDTHRNRIEKPGTVMEREQFKGVLVPQKPAVLEKMEDYPSLSRFALRDSNRVVAIGSIYDTLTPSALESTYGIKSTVLKVEESGKKKKK